MREISDDCRRSLAEARIEQLDGLRNTRLLVTGGTGFIGGWLSAVIACLNDDHGFGIRMTVMARHVAADAGLAAFMARRSDIDVVQADVRQVVELPADVDWIVHAAGSPDNRLHATDPIGTASVIGEGTMHLLRLAGQAASLRRFQFLSSGLVTGEDARIGAASVYAEAKRYGEALTAAFRSQGRVPVVVTRPFTFVGPFQPLDAPWAINTLLHAAINNQPLKLLGSGETVRSYLYGSDAAVLTLLQLTGGASGETFDLGGAEPMRLVDVAGLIVAEVRRPLEIRVNTGGRNVSTAPLLPDMAASGERFGFRPAFTTADAIRRTLSWHTATRHSS